MRISTFLILLAFISFPAFAQSGAKSKLIGKLESGDIVFQYIPCGDLCIAIAEVTPCAPGRPFNHCGIVVKEGYSISILEAIGKNVHATPLAAFLKRDTSALLYIGRLSKSSGVQNDDVIKRARALAGRPYDDVFLPGDSALYCSELVYEAYRNNGKPVFSLSPMTFKSPGTGNTFPAWAEYYNEIGQAIPEGVPGINPCAIANAQNIRLLSFRK